jgi:hypothetical protein
MDLFILGHGLLVTSCFEHDNGTSGFLKIPQKLSASQAGLSSMGLVEISMAAGRLSFHHFRIIQI